MEPIAGWGSQIVYSGGKVNILKLAGRSLCYICRESLRLASNIQLLRTPIRERLDHMPSVICNVTLVNVK